MTTKAEVVAQGGWALAQQQMRAVAPRDEMTVEELVGQVAKIQQVMSAVMKKDEHYGVIPGTPKPTLYKAGAEKLCLLFRLDPQYDSVETWDGKHLTVKSKCTLYHISTGERRGSGEGSCSTKESKYAYRKGARKCPQCGAEAIIKGQQQYGGGWLCYRKKDGCGAKFADGDKKIEGQEVGRVPSEDLPDAYNTVLKMANKRSLIAAVLNVTAASDLFTQDIEELPQYEREQPEPPQHTKTFTREELDAAKERQAAKDAAPRKQEKPQEDPPEAGFGTEPDADPERPYGEPLSQEQLAILHAKIGEKAKNLKVTPARVKETLLAIFDVTSSKDLGRTLWSSVLATLLKMKTADLLPEPAAQQESA